METKIIVKRISPDHEDSFWYDGVLAVKGDREMVACGEIDLRREGDNNFRCNGRKSYDEETAKDNVIYDPAFSNDKDLVAPYYFEANNWFEIVPDGIVCDTYSEALAELNNNN